MEDKKRRTETAKLNGPFNYERMRSGYDPDVSRGGNVSGLGEEKPLHVEGLTLPIDNAVAGLLLGSYRWESVLVHSDGNCSRFDVLHKERKTHYSTRVHGPKNIWNKVWVVDSPGFDGQPETYLVIATNGRFQYGGFTSWDFRTTQFKAKVIQYMNAPTSHNRHWHAVCGPIILHSSTDSRESLLYDIRDGELRHILPHKSRLQAMDYSTPMNWLDEKYIAVAHDSTICLWDVDGQRSYPTMTFPTVLGSVRAMDMDSSRVQSGLLQRKRRSHVTYEGVYCTDHAMYILDKRAKAATAFTLPLNVERVHSVFCTEESIIIGCTMQEYSGVHATTAKVLHVSLTSGTKITSYTIPPCNELGFCTPITQVWADSKYILAQCSTGLYVFDQYQWKERHRTPVDETGLLTLRAILGPSDFENPSFDAYNDRVLITSANHSPIWREI